MTNEAPTKTNVQKLADNHRRMADWLEAHPDLPVPEWGSTVELMIFASTATAEGETPREFMARAARAIGKGRKSYNAEYFSLIAETPSGIKVEVFAQRDQTCERVQTGVRQVVIPAQPAREAEPEKVIEEPVYEWNCTGILDPDDKGRS